MKKLFLYLLALPLAFMSCSDDTPEENKEFENITTTLDDELILTWKTVLINSENEYQDFVKLYMDEYHKKTETPVKSGVNFSKKSIIMVHGAQNRGIPNIEKNLERREGNYYIDITIFHNATFVGNGWYVGYTVPKITNEKVNVNVRYE